MAAHDGTREKTDILDYIRFAADYRSGAPYPVVSPLQTEDFRFQIVRDY
jgi:hypothetical protein